MYYPDCVFLAYMYVHAVPPEAEVLVPGSLLSMIDSLGALLLPYQRANQGESQTVPRHCCKQSKQTRCACLGTPAETLINEWLLH